MTHLVSISVPTADPIDVTNDRSNEPLHHGLLADVERTITSTPSDPSLTFLPFSYGT